jgi:hypothetical protein
VITNPAENPGRQEAVIQGRLLQRLLVASCVLFANAGPVFASGKIGYGSRVGMTVTVVSLEGLDTATAVIRKKHTRDYAIVFCRDYAQDKSDKCIDDELAIPLNDAIYGNCKTGLFTDSSGNRYRFEGRRKGRSDFQSKYAMRDLSTGEIADGSSASGYPTNMGIFKALCPRTAPIDVY